jgi:hypothetical protein
MEQAVKLEAKEIVLRRSLVFIGVGKQLFPYVERVLLVFPPLFAAQIGNRSIEIQLLCCHVWRAGGSVIGNLA